MPNPTAPLLLAISCCSVTAGTVHYHADTSNISNPERGFYHHTETHAKRYQPLSETQLMAYRENEAITQILRVVTVHG